MNLQETVSEILGKEVSLEEAKNFANEQFGLLSAYIRKDLRETVEGQKRVINEYAMGMDRLNETFNKFINKVDEIK